MNNLLLALVFVVLNCTSAISGEIAIPNFELVGKIFLAGNGNLLIGPTNSIQSADIDIEINHGLLTNLTIRYPKDVSVEDIKTAIVKKMNEPVKKFVKESGSNIFVWRDEKKHIAVMFSEKNGEDGRPQIIVHYFETPTGM